MSWTKSLFLVASCLAWAAPAVAEPLLYRLQNANFVRVIAESDFELTFVPLGLGVPISTLTFGSTDVVSRPSGTAVIETGLPDSFSGGAQGITIESFDAHVDVTDNLLLITDLFEPLVPLLPIPPPIPLMGAIASIDVLDLDLSLLTPLSSSLISIADPNAYTWAGVAGLRISGSLNLIIEIPGQDTIAVGPIPFDQVVDPAALTGEFTGDATSTRLVLGSEDIVVPADTLQPIEPIVIPLDLLGSIVVEPKRLRLAVTGNLTAVNTEHGLPPPPSPPGLGCGIGPELAALVPLLAWLRGRRQQRA
jgi:hypothetical protein